MELNFLLLLQYGTGSSNKYTMSNSGKNTTHI